MSSMFRGTVAVLGLGLALGIVGCASDNESQADIQGMAPEAAPTGDSLRGMTQEEQRKAYSQTDTGGTQSYAEQGYPGAR